jgi:hypothetical protein
MGQVEVLIRAGTVAAIGPMARVVLVVVVDVEILVNRETAKETPGAGRCRTANSVELAFSVVVGRLVGAGILRGLMEARRLNLPDVGGQDRRE